jgi:hypothetical protein
MLVGTAVPSSQVQSSVPASVDFGRLAPTQ